MPVIEKPPEVVRDTTDRPGLSDGGAAHSRRKFQIALTDERLCSGTRNALRIALASTDPDKRSTRSFR